MVTVDKAKPLNRSSPKPATVITSTQLLDPEPLPSAGSAFAGAPMAVLVIEDNRGDARLLREMFTDPFSPGATILHVETMAAAEEYLQQQAVDVILLDLGLPDVQGVEAVRRARAAAPRVPVVVLTALMTKRWPAKHSRKGHRTT